MTEGEQQSLAMLGDLIRLLDAAYDLRREIDGWARDSYGLPLTQLMTLMAIAKLDGQAKVSDIAREVGRKSHTITAVIDVLVEKGLVNRYRAHAGDRRVVNVQLTGEGERLASRRVTPGAPLSVVGAGDHADIQRAAEVLERLVED